MTSRARLAPFLTAPLIVASVCAQPPHLRKVTINYATRTGTKWPLYIAMEAGYFRKYGLDASTVFGVHPAGIAMVVSGEAAMTNYPLEQAMIAASRDGRWRLSAAPTARASRTQATTTISMRPPSTCSRRAWWRPIPSCPNC